VDEAIGIPLGLAHQVENSSEELMIFIGVQRSDYLGENDIMRPEDDFARHLS
jgi:mannose-6-phosphate isomerase-like protein (cupin superfamily)